VKIFLMFIYININRIHSITNIFTNTSPIPIRVGSLDCSHQGVFNCLFISYLIFMEITCCNVHEYIHKRANHQHQATPPAQIEGLVERVKFVWEIWPVRYLLYKNVLSGEIVPALDRCFAMSYQKDVRWIYVR
jgi:hypothetical protein